MPTTSGTRGSYADIETRVRLERVGELLADGTVTPAPGASERGLAVTPAEPALLDAVSRFVALLDTPQDIGALSPLVLREITYRVLSGSQGARLGQIAATGAPAHRIALAIDG